MSYVRSFDRAGISAVEKLPRSALSSMTVVSFIGAPVTAVIIFGVVMMVTYAERNTSLLLSQFIVLAALPLASILKLLTRRKRPETMYVEKMLFKSYSFPSGHAHASLLVFGFLAFMSLQFIVAPWSWVIASFLAAFIGLVGISRVYLGAHFPSDVLGGWIIGGFALFLIIHF